MILYPAIDLKDGQCVRVLHGDLSTATVFNTDPAEQAEAWVAAGFDWLHVVDLNGSVQGKAVNATAVEAILHAVSIPVQLGGGIRSLAGIEGWIEAGVSRVILGTAAVRNPDLVKTAARRWPEQIAVSVDVRKGQVAVRGLDWRIPGSTRSDRGQAVRGRRRLGPDRHRHRSRWRPDRFRYVEVFGTMADAVRHTGDRRRRPRQRGNDVEHLRDRGPARRSPARCWAARSTSARSRSARGAGRGGLRPAC